MTGRMRKFFNYLRRKGSRFMSRIREMSTNRRTSEDAVVPDLLRGWDYPDRRRNGQNVKVGLMIQNALRGRTPHCNFIPPFLQGPARPRADRANVVVERVNAMACQGNALLDGGNRTVGKRLAENEEVTLGSRSSQHIYWDFWDGMLAIVYYDDGVETELIDIRRIRHPLSLPSRRFKPLEQTPIEGCVCRGNYSMLCIPPSWQQFWDLWDSTIAVLYADDGTGPQLLEIRRIRGTEPLSPKRYKPLEETPVFTL